MEEPLRGAPVAASAYRRVYMCMCLLLFLPAVSSVGCEGYCGGYASGQGCWCDDGCFSYRDCCRPMTTIYKTNTPWTSHWYVPGGYVPTCKSPGSLSISLGGATATTNGGYSVTLSGNNFIGCMNGNCGYNALRINGAQVSTSSWTDVKIVFTAPAGQGENLAVKVNNYYNLEITSNIFSYAPPTITSTTPSPLSAYTQGGQITLFGNNFGAIQPSVTLGGTACSINSFVAHSRIVVNVPAGKGSNLNLVVNVGGQNSAAVAMSYSAPAISTVSPEVVKAGDTLTINGNSFGNAAGSVTLGGTACAATAWGHTQIKCTVPVGAGKASQNPIVVEFSGLTSALTPKSVAYAAPTLVSMTPANGPTSGVTAEITGTGFGDDLSVVQLNFGSVQCTAGSCNLQLVSNTKITFSVPEGFGVVSVSVTVAYQSSPNPLSFTYDDPTISSITPSSGDTAGGYTVEIIGSSFGKTASVTLDGASCSKVSQTHTKIIATIPAGTGANLAMQVALIGKSNTMAFSYNPPSVTSAVPQGGNPLTQGGSTLVVSGKNFGQATGRVQVGGDDCSPITWSDTSIQCTLAEGQGKDVTVSVTADGQTGSKTGAFSFAAPTISTTSASGPTEGQNMVTIAGANFGTSATVLIGSTACPVTSQAHLELVCKAAAYTGDTQVVSVTVSVGGQQVVKNNIYTYAVPNIASMFPTTDSTSGGKQITLRGSSFGSDGSVLFDNFPAALQSAKGDSWGHGEIKVTVPPGEGTVSVTISSGHGSSSGKTFTYEIPAVTSISPSKADTGCSNTWTCEQDGANYLVRCNGAAPGWSGGQPSESYALLSACNAEVTSPDGWVANNPTFVCARSCLPRMGLPKICAEAALTAVGNVCGQFTSTSAAHAAAKQSCETVGARLCTVAEIKTLSGGGSNAAWAEDTSGCSAGEAKRVVYSSKAESCAHVSSSSPYYCCYDKDVAFSPFVRAKLTGATPSSTSTQSNWLACQTWCRDQSNCLSVQYNDGTKTCLSFTKFWEEVATSATVSSTDRVANRVNGSPSARALVVSGKNFGTSPNVKVLVGGKTCPKISHGHTSITCALPDGQGEAQQVSVESMGVTSNIAYFSYSDPFIRTVLLSAGATAPTAGGAVLTLLGNSFGTTGASVKIETRDCVVTLQTSTKVTCTVPAGEGTDQEVKLAIGNQVSNVMRISYSGPVADGINPTGNFLTAGNQELTITGSNFGLATPSVRVGALNCEVVSNTHNTVIVKTPAGEGVGLEILVIAGGQTSTKGNAMPTFDYGAPSVTSVVATSFPTSGGVALTVNGLNFGLTGRPTIGGVVCSISSRSHVKLVCPLPPGQGTGIPVEVTVDGRASTELITINYETATVTSMEPQTGPTAGYSGFTAFGSTITVAASGSGDCRAPNGASLVIEFPAASSPPASGTAVNIASQYVCKTSDYQPGSLPVCTTGSGNKVYALTDCSPSPPAGQHALLYEAGVLIIKGQNFGASGIVLVGSKSCVPVSKGWSHTQISCKLPEGEGKNIAVTVNVGGSTSTENILFSYDIPTISAVLPSTGDTAGGTSVSIGGNNFGLSPVVTIGTLSCTKTFSTHTAVFCTTAEGDGTNLPVKVVVASQMATMTSAFSYDEPKIFSANPKNGGTEGGVFITLSGQSFGKTPGSVAVGGAISTNILSWSHTQIIFGLPQGEGGNQDILITTAAPFSRGATLSSGISYDPPVITAITPSFADTGGAGQERLTVTGKNFGSSAIVTIDGKTCTDATVTNTKVECLIPVGQGQNLGVVVSAGSVFSNTRSFSYNNPNLVSITPASGPTQGNIELTLTGSSMGLSGGVIKLGSQTCNVVSQDHNQVKVLLPEGSGANVELQMSIGSQLSNILRFDYIKPAITIVNPNHGPTLGGNDVTLTGTNFGPAGSNHEVFIGGQPCTVKSATHDKIIFTMLPGQDINRPLVVTVGTLSSIAALYSYDAPVVTSINPSSILTQGATLTIAGSNFGQTPQVSLAKGGVVYGSCSVTSNSADHTEILCDAPEGQGKDVQVVVTVGTQGSAPSAASMFRYNPPSITSISPTLGPTAGGASIVISGTNLGRSGSIMIGSKECPVQYGSHTHTSVRCTLPEGEGSNLAVVITIGDVLSNSNVLFSYSTPVITDILPTTIGTEGGSITILGSDFGTGGSVTVNDIPCNPTGAGYRHSRIECTAPAGVDVVVVKVAAVGQVVKTSDLTYKGPAITSISPTSFLTDGGGTLVVTGTNFGPSTTAGVARSVSIGSSTCASPVFTHTQITCTIQAFYGVDLPVSVKIAGGKSNDVLFSYTAPTIMKVSGCPENDATSTRKCSVSTTSTITVEGTSFGDATAGLHVKVNSKDCTITSWSHRKIICTIQPDAGIDVAVVVMRKDGQKDSKNYISFSAPEVDAGSLHVCTNPAQKGTVALATTTGGTEICFSGTEFGTDKLKVTVTYGLEEDSYSRYTCTVQEVTAVSIRCSLSAGVGKNLLFRVTVDNLLVGTRVSRSSIDSLTYGQPALTPNTIRLLVDDSKRLSKVIGTTTVGQFVQFDATNFGTDASLLTISYETPGHDALACTSVSVTSTYIQCRTSPVPIGYPEIADYVFTVTALNYPSDQGTDKYSYPKPPTITQVTSTGCTNAGMSAVDCPTKGGVTITIDGADFAAGSIVKVGINTCTNFVLLSTSRITCELPPGAGLNQPVVVIVGLLFSPSKNLVSYSAPVIDSITGCTDTVYGTTLCPRTGNHLVTITGTNLGASGALVLVGGNGSPVVQHDLATPHEKLTFQLPDGKGLVQTLLMVQARGEPSVSSLTVSYAQCPASTHETDTLACNPCDVGKYTPMVGLQSCIECEAGFFADNTGSSDCTRCPVGKRSSTALAAAGCTACGGGKVAAYLGQTSCTDCPAGSYSQGTQKSACLLCDTGKAVSAAGRTTCDACDAGNFAATTGQLACDSCRPGSYSLGSATTCILCDEGTLQNLGGQSSCRDCKAGTVSTAKGQVSCQACQGGTVAATDKMKACLKCGKGKYSVNKNGQGATACVDCSAGSYSSATGQASCVACPLGKFNDGVGQSACEDCIAGRVGSLSSQGVCIDCQAGKYSPKGGSVSCINCPLGTFTATGAQSTCEACGAGYFQDSQGSSSCKECGMGFFNPATGQQSCAGCPSGSNSNTTGSSECALCVAGYYSLKTSEQGPVQCNICPIGKYSSIQGQPSCVSCPVGTVAATAGLTGCTSCSAGKHAPLPGLGLCEGCAKGKFSLQGAFSCTNCEPGSFSSADNPAYCIKCAPGFKQGLPGQSSCDECSKGFFTAAEGQDQCLICPIGKFQADTKQSGCDDCLPGTAQSEAGKSACSECVAGTATGVAGQASCSECEQGRFSAVSKAKSCESCMAGKYNDQLGSTVCKACALGKYASDTNSLGCQPCPIGYYGETEQLTACTMCAMGSFQSSAGGETCILCTAGRYSPAMGQEECQPCAAGTFTGISNQTECTACPKGTYNPSSAQTECTDCAKGSFSAGIGAVGCDLCPIGYYAGNETSESCQPCAVGKFSDILGRSECNDCASGQFQSNEGQGVCLDCVTGRYQSAGGKSTCELCAAGKSQSKEKQADCENCTKGRFTGVSGQAFCDLCPAGTFGEMDGQQACVNCVAGKYQGQSGATLCLDCSEGYSSTRSGSVSCDVCGLGKFIADKGSNESCKLCPEGKSMGIIGGSECQNCPDGFYASDKAQAGCIICPAGRFGQKNQDGTTSSCSACPVGQYMPSEGQTSCHNCPKGKFTASVGQAICVDCAPGEFNAFVGRSNCSACEPGTFASDTGAESCTECGLGTFTPEYGSLSCKLCPVGKKGDSKKLTQCVQCLSGYFQPKQGEATCLACLQGKYTAGVEQSRCLECPAGKSTATSASSDCSPCDAGDYQPAQGKPNCLACPPGSHAENPGSVGCLECVAGSFTGAFGMSSCEACAAGSFQSFRGQSSCSPCLPGSAQGIEGQKICTSCEPGKYSNTTGKTACDACLKGSYSNVGSGIFGPDKCTPCAPGSYTSTGGQAVCAECGPGTFNAGTGQETCENCPAGSYTNQKGQSVCLVCPPGFYAGTDGSESCTVCKEGTIAPKNNSVSCDECAAGKFQPLSGQVQCLNCTSGTYGPTQGLAACLLCAIGRTADTVGQDECKDCPAGYIANTTGAKRCVPCGHGEFQQNPGQGQCFDCPIGTRSAGLNASQCTDCEPGNYQDEEGQLQCRPCPAGSFVAASGQYACKPCPIGTFTNTSGNPICPTCLPGKVNGQAGLTACKNCELGTYPISPINCGKCPPGRFGEDEGQDECTPCPAGQFEEKYGQVSCQDCPIGRFTGVPAQFVCKSCNAGTYSNVSGLSLCVDCEPGRFTDLLNATTCQNCPKAEFSSLPGQYRCQVCPPGRKNNKEGVAICEECEAGRFNPIETQTSCQDCGVGTYAPPGQLGCSPCLPGKFNAKTVQGACEDCPVGEYQSETAKLGCEKCSKGRFSRNVGQITCSLCPLGRIGRASGQQDCDACPGGTFMDQLGWPNASQTSCFECEMGKFAGTQGGAMYCTYCPPGKFGLQNGMTGCEDCPGGEYSKAGATSCTKCKVGTYNKGKQSTCESCDAGTYNFVPGATACLDCLPGKHQPNRGNDTCLECTPGKVTFEPRKAHCVACGTASYGDKPGMTECLACQVGKHQNRTGQTVCDSCSPGRFGNSSRMEECNLCTPGKFGKTWEALACTPCPVGEATEEYQAQACQQCVLGKHSPIPGAPLCLLCEPGSFASAVGLETCTKCSPGLYQAYKGTTGCNACPEGTFARDEGQEDCDACEAGRFNPNTGASACPFCNAGEYQNNPGSTQCEYCTPGRYALGGGIFVQCDSCAPGKFNNATRQTTCDDCAPGTFSDSKEATVCNVCGIGKFSKNGSAECTLCLPGKVAPSNGSASCEACGRNATANGQRTDCVCAEAYFRRRNQMFADCEKCPPGADCRQTGTLLDNMGTLPDYWRTTFRGETNRSAEEANSLTSAYSEDQLLSFFRCPYTGMCCAGQCCENRDTDTPLCGACKLQYHSFMGQGCSECPESVGASMAYLVFVALLGFFGFVGVVFVLLKSISPLLKAERTLQYREEGHDPVEGPPLNAMAEESEMEMSMEDGRIIFPESFTYKFKIMIGFLQIVTNIGVALEIPWPSGLKSFIQFFNIANLDFLQASNLECIMEPGTVYYRKFTVMSMSPAIMLGGIFVLYTLPSFVLIKMGKHIKLEEGIDLQTTQRKALHRLKMKTIRIVIFSLFLIYPTVSSTVIRLFVCKEFDGVSHLLTDLRTLCYDARWNTYASWGGVLAFVYPIGIPLFFFTLMYRKRKELKRPGVVAQFGLLYHGYWNLWWFEMLDMAHKLLLVALISFFPQGMELRVGLCISTSYLVAILLLNPYKRWTDDLFHMLVQVYVFVYLYSGLLYTIEYPDEITDFVASAIMITVLCLVVLYALSRVFLGGLEIILRKIGKPNLFKRSKASDGLLKNSSKDMSSVSFSAADRVSGKGNLVLARSEKDHTKIRHVRDESGQWRQMNTLGNLDASFNSSFSLDKTAAFSPSKAIITGDTATQNKMAASSSSNLFTGVTDDPSVAVSASPKSSKPGEAADTPDFWSHADEDGL